jgi:alkylation response protein AidB-like acyl-CoA dehydrogenase
MIGATSGVLSAYLAPDAAAEIFADPQTISGGVFAPLGRATRTADGFRVQGRWPFASGCQHCTWLLGGCVIAPTTAGEAPPAPRLMFVPARSARIIDNWDVAVLRGTGSHDIAIDDVAVAERYSASLVTDRPHHPGPLYSFPVFGLLALGISAVALGIARRALDELTALATAKRPQGSRRALAERSVIQVEVAEAEARLRAARALVRERVSIAYDAAERDGTIATEDRALLRLAATHAARESAAVGDLMFRAAGGSAIYATSPLQRCLRDLHTLTQHVMVGGTTLELTGRCLLGVPTDLSQL